MKEGRELIGVLKRRLDKWRVGGLLLRWGKVEVWKRYGKRVAEAREER